MKLRRHKPRFAGELHGLLAVEFESLLGFIVK
jgi:hypothetical protein